jgi:DNA-binding NarL/FixJ family response regulator
MARVRILIVEDHPIYRHALRTSLEREPDLVVVGEAADGQAAIQQADLLEPDVLVCDMTLPGVSGLEVARVVRRRRAACGVVILATHGGEELLFDAVRVGVAAYVAKSLTSDELVGVVRRVGRGEYVIDQEVLARPQVARRVLGAFRELALAGEEAAGGVSPLTAREIEILDCVARGHSNKEIAHSLSISDQTVKNHLTSILRKLSVSDRTQAVIHALRQGWMTVDAESRSAIDRATRLH